MLRSILMILMMAFSFNTKTSQAQPFASDNQNSINTQVQDIIEGLDFSNIQDEAVLNLEFEVSSEGQIVDVLLKGGNSLIQGKIKNSLLGRWLFDTEESWVAIGRRYSTNLHIFRV